MPARKMRIEVFDENGNRYTITLEGHVTRENALRLLDLVELLGGIPQENNKSCLVASALSKIEKVRLIVRKFFPMGWFSSKEILSAYEQEFKEPIGLSTVSTYLSRMAHSGFLARNKVSNRRRYRIEKETIQPIFRKIKK